MKHVTDDAQRRIANYLARIATREQAVAIFSQADPGQRFKEIWVIPAWKVVGSEPITIPEPANTAELYCASGGVPIEGVTGKWQDLWVFHREDQERQGRLLNHPEGLIGSTQALRQYGAISSHGFTSGRRSCVLSHEFATTWQLSGRRARGAHRPLRELVEAETMRIDIPEGNGPFRFLELVVGNLHLLRFTVSGESHTYLALPDAYE